MILSVRVAEKRVWLMYGRRQLLFVVHLVIYSAQLAPLVTRLLPFALFSRCATHGVGRSVYVSIGFHSRAMCNLWRQFVVTCYAFYSSPQLGSVSVNSPVIITCSLEAFVDSTRADWYTTNPNRKFLTVHCWDEDAKLKRCHGSCCSSQKFFKT